MVKKAFTLAEVLVTMAIIGIVAAITLPSLINDYQQKVYKETWKKAYSEISGIALQMSYDYEVSTLKDIFEIEKGKNPDLPEQQISKSIFSKYFKNSKINCNGECDNTWKWGCKGIISNYGPKGEMYYNGFRYLNGDLTGYWVIGYFGQICVQTANYTFFGEAPMGSYSRIGTFVVDVNGIKPPNIVGIDMFVLNINNLLKGKAAGENDFYSGDDYACDKNAKYAGVACSSEYLRK